MTTATFRTPGGHLAVMEYRDGTSDWNTIAACLLNPMADTGDEYGIPSGLTGWALDIGAHIGSVTVGLLLDNPDLRVLAIEAVRDNVKLIYRNLEANGVSDRAVIKHAAAWEGSGNIEVESGYTGNETADVHRWIGSVSPWLDLPKGGTKRKARVPIITLAEAIDATGGEGFVWVKSDCEGCEHRFLKGDGLARLQYIIGEWHTRDGSPEDFASQLNATHDVTWSYGDPTGGPFEAVLR